MAASRDLRRFCSGGAREASARESGACAGPTSARDSSQPARARADCGPCALEGSFRVSCAQCGRRPVRIPPSKRHRQCTQPGFAHWRACSAGGLYSAARTQCTNPLRNGAASVQSRLYRAGSIPWRYVLVTAASPTPRRAGSTPSPQGRRPHLIVPAVAGGEGAVSGLVWARGSLRHAPRAAETRRCRAPRAVPCAAAREPCPQGRVRPPSAERVT